MSRVLVDAGPLIALFDKSDAEHKRVLNWIMNFKGRMVTTWPVITETVHMLDFHRDAPIDFLNWVNAGGLEIHELNPFDLERITEIMETYRDLPSDLADTTLVFVAEETGIRKIATIDSDFYVYRTADGNYLENVLYGGGNVEC